MYKRRIYWAVFAATLGVGATASDTLNVSLYFPLSDAVYRNSFRGNAMRMDSLLLELGFCSRKMDVSDITIRSSASPEGNTEFNRRLSLQRGNAIKLYLTKRLGLPDSLFRHIVCGEDWEGVRRKVEASQMSWRSEVLEILDRTSGADSDGGVSDVALPTLPVSGLIAVSELTPHQPKPFYMGIKSNMLFDVLLVPNLGVELYLGKGWSAGVNWVYAWWKNDRCHRYWRVYGGELEMRRYFGRKAVEKPLTGHHVSVYGQFFTYDIELGGKGYMGGRPGGTLWDRANYGGGIAYGYSHPIGRCLNLDFTIGVGYIGGQYYEYTPGVMPGHYIWQSTRKIRMIGPTKAEVSLVWLVGRGNRNMRKGGRK